MICLGIEFSLKIKFMKILNYQHEYNICKQMNRLVFRTSRAFCNTLPESAKMGTSPDVVSSKLDRLIQEQKKRELQERQEYGISYVV